MTVRSPNAYLLSAMLHLSLVALILVLAMGLNHQGQESPKVFELVAGAGNNYGATVAPALGIPGGIKLSVPQAPAPETPPAPESPPTQEPSAQAAPMVEAAPAPAAKSAKAPADFTKILKRAAARRAARLDARYKKQLAAAEKRRQAEEAKADAKTPRIDTEGIREGLLGGSTANKEGGAGGKALTREEGDLLEAYIELLKSRLKESFEGLKPTDVSDKLTASVAFYLAADGSISNVRIARTSGNSEFDSAVLEAFSQTSSIGPRPDHRGEQLSLDFAMREDDSAE